MFYICSMTDLHIIWFQSDLRVHDHAALRGACASAARDGGEVLALAILPSERRLTAFRYDGLADLRDALEVRALPLHVRTGDTIAILSELHQKHRILSLHCHEPYTPSERDRGLEAWTLRAGIAFRTYPQFRPSPYASEDSWTAFVSRPRFEAPDIPATANVGIGAWPADPAPHADTTEARGGRKQAIALLRSFLQPAHAPREPDQALSGGGMFRQIEPYLQLGAISVREAWQAAQSARHQYVAARLESRVEQVEGFLTALQAFGCRNERSVSRQDQPQDGPQLSLDFQSPNAA
ncbi:MAG: deoxyribodipyrimidine photo-lyase [Pseudomonadota bacterium]